MQRVRRAKTTLRRVMPACLGLILLGCDKAEEPTARPSVSTAKAAPSTAPAKAAVKVDVREAAMGTEVRIVAYSSATADEAATRQAIKRSMTEIRRLESLMTSWRDDSEVAELNRKAGSFVKVSPETFQVIERSLWAGKFSQGTFDITFSPLSEVWKFGDAKVDDPRIPNKAELAPLLARVDYKKIQLKPKESQVALGTGQRVDLGGIAKGFVVDAAVAVLRKNGVQAFLVQAGGDLYGAGKKADGSPWVSGIRDPRGKANDFFATLQLEDRAFSTAGDYARAFIKDGKRFHHILDPRTGFPATACRSVTVYAKDALTADAVDDAVFILGPEIGLKLVEELDGVGAVVVDDKNRVHISKLLKGKVRVTRQPSDGI